MDSDAEAFRREFWASLALRHCRGLGPRTVCRLLRHYGSAYAAVQARERWREAHVGADKATALASGSWRVTAREEWDRARGLPARVVLWTDPAYPPLLRRLPDAPALLYCRGDLSLLSAPAFAIVGSRKASPQGRTVAAHMARSLSACGMTIVSGMALGIDSAAHEAALERVGRSVGVLGTGIDTTYPRANAPLFAAMERQGLLLTEFAPGTPPQPGHFPIRNRIISGLSLGVLVVEAAKRSGSLITARLALEQNREVFAIPGPALDTRCEGCHELVREGAHAVFCADDVLQDMAELLRPYGISAQDLPARGERPGAQEPAPTEPPQKEGGPHTDAVPRPATPQETALAASLSSGRGRASLLDYLRTHGPAQADELAEAAGLAAQEASAALVGLEMLGQVRRLPGARYEALP